MKFGGEQMVKVFLGGTCNNSTWRERLIPLLHIDYFDPVVDDWNEECQKREIEERENADFCLYVLTPKMTGVYSIAEVTDDSNKRPEKTILCILNEDIDDRELRHIWPAGMEHSLEAVKNLVNANGAYTAHSLGAVAMFLNREGEK
jgi:hypothetical protein